MRPLLSFRPTVEEPGGVILQLRETVGRLFGAKEPPTPRTISYDEAKQLAASADPEQRRVVASDPDTKPELLYFLARDMSPAVRAAVASHPATPRQADLILALDEAPDIRTVIAEKVTHQVRSMGQDEAAQLWQLTVSVLEALAKDDLPRVRLLVAESARGLERLPRQLAVTLAKDRETSVAVAALNYPGKIDDEDLVSIVQGARDMRVVGAVAARPGIGSPVADAVVATGDETAIGLLLANGSASISAAALDRIIDRAPLVPAWHEPLVTRPFLGRHAAARLLGFVTGPLADMLSTRTDLDRAPPGSATKGGAATLPVPASPLVPEVLPPPESPLGRARRLYYEGRLTEDAVIDGLSGEIDFTIAALALRSRLAPTVVAKILGSQSAKGLTSLAWKAGYSMRLALQLQIRIGRLPPKARLNSFGGGWPLMQTEMEWQIDFFITLASEA
jgi:uncharacterized protein (DUF2336 family)